MIRRSLFHAMLPLGLAGSLAGAQTPAAPPAAPPAGPRAPLLSPEVRWGADKSGWALFGP